MTPADERLIQQFERAWTDGQPPELGPFAAAAADPATVRELVLVDLEFRWRQYREAASDWLGPDLPPPVEEYARHLPRLGLTDDVIAEEYRARHAWGDQPEVAVFVDRFPDRPALPARLAEVAAELLRERTAQAPAAQPAAPVPPESVVVDGYAVGDVIAAGATGTVYSAISESGDPAAVKVIHPHMLADADARGRFDREARLLLEVRHPNVVRVLAVGRSGGRAVIVMERVSGTDLARRVRRSGPLPLRQACAVLAQAAAGLAHLHARGIAHRDVSPSNILLDDNGRATLLDLGLAKRVEASGGSAGEVSHSSWVTPEGNALFGTPDYVAPETIRDCTAAGPPADVYGLGGVGVFLLTAAPPFPAGTPLEKLFQHLTAPPPDMGLRAGVPDAMTELLTRCLAKHVTDRPPAEEVARVCLSLSG